MNCYNIPDFLNHFFSTWISYERTYLRSNKGEHNDEKVEEFKMLSGVNKPLLDLDKYRLNELINTLQKNSNDSSINIHQADLDRT
jgi:hypothetical protein